MRPSDRSGRRVGGENRRSNSSALVGRLDGGDDLQPDRMPAPQVSHSSRQRVVLSSFRQPEAGDAPRNGVQLRMFRNSWRRSVARLADMAVTRIVPDITSKDIPRSTGFYRLLGLEERMNLGWTVILGPSGNPDVQLLLMERDESAPMNPDISIGVEDVDAAHEKMVIAGAEIVHSLRDESWGVRRFFVRDPNGKIVNVVQNL